MPNSSQPRAAASITCEGHSAVPSISICTAIRDIRYTQVGITCQYNNTVINYNILRVKNIFSQFESNLFTSCRGRGVSKELDDAAVVVDDVDVDKDEDRVDVTIAACS